MNERKWLLATLSEDAASLAGQYGLELELDAFCTAANMDADFAYWDHVVRKQLTHAPAQVLHAPFAELFPCAIDPRARRLAMERFQQAARIARRYGIRRMVTHLGYLPHVYYPEWFEEQSARFWREFLASQPEDFELLIENVLDEAPLSLLRMIGGIGDDRAAACLDVGHAQVISNHSATAWIETLAPYLKHVHLHNNFGASDDHNPPDLGLLDVKTLLRHLDHFAPGATITLECPDAHGAVAWLQGWRKSQHSSQM